MDKQIIEISDDDFILLLSRGFLEVENKETNLKSQIPLDNVLSIIISANNIIVLYNLLN